MGFPGGVVVQSLSWVQLCNAMHCSTPGCPSQYSRAFSNSCPLSQRCHPPISTSVIPFFSCFQSFPTSGSFPMSQPFESRWLSGKEPDCQCRRHKGRRFNLWVGKMSWRREWQSTPVFLPGKFHGQRGAWWATVHGVTKGHIHNSPPGTHHHHYRKFITGEINQFFTKRSLFNDKWTLLMTGL